MPTSTKKPGKKKAPPVTEAAEVERTPCGRPARRTRTKQLPAEFQAGFLVSLDGRTELARALRDNFKAIVDDMGGEDELSHVKRTLVERFCWLEAIMQTIEQEMATGAINKGEAIGRWIQAVNSLTGLAKTLGLERVAVAHFYNAPALPKANP